MDYIEEDIQEGKISSFNSAMFINLRMHQLWVDANNQSRRSAFSSWNSTLDRIWCELGGDVDIGSDEEKEFEKLQAELETISPIINWKTQNGFEKKKDDDSKLQFNQYKMLIKKELFLRRLQNKQGKGTAYRDASEDYMDN